MDAGDDAHQALLQHPGAEGVGVHAELPDVHKHVEGALRLLHVQAHVHQALVDVVPAPAEDLHHIAGVRLQGRDASPLDKGGHGGDTVLVEHLDPVHQLGVRHAVAQAPAGHGIRLGEALDHNDPVPHVLVLSKAVVVLTVGQSAVHIVAQDKDGLVLEDGVDGVQGLLGVDAAGGIVGGGQDDGLGPVGDGGLQFLRHDLEVVVLCGQGDRHTALQLDQRLIQAEGRGGDDDLVPWVQDGGEGGEQRLRGAHRQDDLTGGVVEAMGLSLEFGDGLQRVGIAVAGGIVGIVGVQSGLGGLLDDVGGVQIRLADGQGAGAGGIPHQIGELPDAGQLHAHNGIVQSQVHGFSRSFLFMKFSISG